MVVDNNINYFRGLCFICKMKIEYILFWIFILAVIGIAIWMLFGSPTLEAGLISIGLFVAGSEILLWRNLFAVDKGAAVGFERVRSDFKIIKKDIKDIKDNIININKKLK